MPISSMNLSKREEKKVPAAAELFTDRKEPQEQFERKLRLIEQYRKDAFGVLCFYGIGGIGKTALMNRLIRLLDHEEGISRILPDEISALHAAFDFGAEGIEKDKTTMLTSLRNQLSEADPRFRFVLFDTARYVYLKKLGMDVSKDKEMSFIIERNVWLKSAVNALGAAPIVGWISSMAQAVDGILAGINDKVESNNKKYKEKLNEIARLMPSEIIDRLHEYFAEDVRINVSSKIDKPIVIFLDTYEKYVDGMNSDALRLDVDQWLRKGRNSLIQSVPGILWVIMGREKMDWREDDGENWDEEKDPTIPLADLSEEEKELYAGNTLEQHLLGDLSEKDALSYFAKAGIEDAELSKELYLLTNGTPIYMDICVKHYRSLGGSKIGIDDFGKDLNELINRYLKHVPPQYRQMLYVASTLEIWDDEKFRFVVERLDQKDWYNEDRYADFLKHSFVIRDQEGEYYVHDTVREACVDCVNQSLSREIHEAALEYGGIYELIHDCVYPGADYRKAMDYLSRIDEVLERNSWLGKNENNLMILQELYDRAEMVFPDSAYLYAVGSRIAFWLSVSGMITQALEMLESVELPECADDEWKCLLEAESGNGMVYSRAGRYQDAFNVYLVLYEKKRQLFGDEDPVTLNALLEVGKACGDLGDYQKACSIKKEVYEKQKKVLGEKHQDTLQTLSFIGMDYASAQEHQTALDIFQRVYEGLKQTLGEKNLSTIDALSNVGSAWLRLGDASKALEIYQKTFEEYREILGEAAPKTLDALSKIGDAWMQMGDVQKSLGIYQETYEKRKELFGELHPDVIDSLANVGEALLQAGELQRALDVCSETYEKTKEVYGEDHPETADRLFDIAFVYCEAGDLQNAVPIFENVWEMKKAALGEDHPETIECHEWLLQVKEALQELS